LWNALAPAARQAAPDSLKPESKRDESTFGPVDRCCDWSPVTRTKPSLSERPALAGMSPLGVPEEFDDVLRPVIRSFRQRYPRTPVARIVMAYETAATAHAGQTRRSGEPYVTHPVGVAAILAELGLDDITLASAILHDAVEDTKLTLDDLTAGFGPEVAAIVDGVTKLDRLEFDSKEAQQAATMRKMLVAMAKDLRVLLIKLADRLHNMRTIRALHVDKQRRIAQETLDIYAPLAHRMGLGAMKHELEDLSFAVLEPRKHAEIEAMVGTRAPERERYLEMALDTVREKLDELAIEAEVSGRPKHLWSIYDKMVVKGKEFDEIHDLIGIRVIVDSVKDCYAALGTIHAQFKPVQGRFKDYIAMPKFNLYQSLHTTVVGPDGKVFECQVRTTDMHRLAEYGVAAHWQYKQSRSSDGGELVNPNEAAWLRRLAERSETSDEDDPEEFLATLKYDLDQDEVFVFTPKGKVVTLPVSATPIDFAYSIHTNVGHRCIGARVNGRLVPLDTKLTSGETIEIITSKVETAQPSSDWLRIVVTPRARNKIKQWFSKERREDALEHGRDELVKAMRREGLPVAKLVGLPAVDAVVVALGFEDLEAVQVAVGEGHISALNVAQRIARELRGGSHEEQLPTTTRSRPVDRRERARRGVGVNVEGLDDVMVRLAKCCTPVPGDPIVGFVTRGRGVSVHRADCANSNSLRTDTLGRMIEVEWDANPASATSAYFLSIIVEALDRQALLADVARVLSENRVNVLGCTTQTGLDRVARLRFDFEMADPSHLDAVLAAVRKVDSVYEVERVVPNGRKQERAS
jgi:GTP diphosphokinase / guanosine-3',5'-bis(diphosphate) 3'-diphosphatase